MLSFLNIDLGKVTAEFYTSVAPVVVQTLLDRADFKQKDPIQTGKLDNMVSASYYDKNIGYRMAGFFIAPMSGNHIFTVPCDDYVTFTLITVPVLIPQITRLLM